MTDQTPDDRFHELATMPYTEYLLTPEWQARRIQALARADSRCMICYTSEHLNAHHRTYERRGNERPEDLTVLCESCHHLYHAAKQLRERKTAFYTVRDTVMDELEMITDRNRNGMLSTGYAHLDQITTGLRPEQLYAVSGCPNMGKSSLLLSIGLHVAQAKKRVLYLSLEMSISTITTRLVAMYAKKDRQYMQLGYIEDGEWDTLLDKVGDLAELPFAVSAPDDTTFSSLNLHIAEYIREQGNIDLLLIDNIGMVETEGREWKEQHAETLCRSLKQLARHYHIPLLVSCPLPVLKERRQDIHPTPFDLRVAGWGAIDMYADAIFLLHRDEIYNSATEWKNVLVLTIAKNRQGPIGEVSLYFDARQGLIDDFKVAPPLEEEV